MTNFLVDSILLLTLLAVGVWILAARSAFAATTAFVAYGLLLAVAWVRLESADVALTEAAIGAGVTGVLLIRAISRMRVTGPIVDRAPPGLLLRISVGACCVVVAGGLALALFFLPEPAPTQATAVLANLPSTGVANPVTGVLLAYRAVDTLLEAVVIVIALLGVWSMGPDHQWGGRPGLKQVPELDGPLHLLASVLPPIGILIGVYIFWIGTDMPGGKFQAGTILGAMWILVWLAGRTEPPRSASGWLRLVLVAGTVWFLAVGFAGVVLADAFLAYPEGFAKPLIVAIEAVLTLSIAATLGLLVVGWPARDAPP